MATNFASRVANTRQRNPVAKVLKTQPVRWRTRKKTFGKDLLTGSYEAIKTRHIDRETAVKSLTTW